MVEGIASAAEYMAAFVQGIASVALARRCRAQEFAGECLDVSVDPDGCLRDVRADLSRTCRSKQC